VKHPVNKGSHFIAWFLGWLFIAIGQSLLFYFIYGEFINLSILDSIVSFLIFSGIALSLWYPLSFFNTTKSNTLNLILNLLITGGISLAIWIILTKYIMLAILPDQNNYLSFWDTTLSYRIGTGVFMYCIIVLSFYLYISLINLSEKKTKEVKLENLLKEIELKLLRSQINPHFLFNSLNSISSLTITDPEKARTMVVKLSEFIRYALSRKDEQFVSLRSELENLGLYLDIEKVRFGDRLSTEEEIENECLDVKIPVMLLQPLYENAIKHGVYESTECVKIYTVAKRTDNYLEINISNNYDEKYTPLKGTGTGLLNVTRRLELFYGNNSSLQTTREKGIYIVKIFIPFNLF
jgi:two-component system, LytTR family, sensor kinase